MSQMLSPGRPHPKPVPGHVSRGERLKPYRKAQRILVMRRAGCEHPERALPWGACEGCRRIRQLTWAHLGGRGSRPTWPDEPWISSSALTCALCAECHTAMDAHQAPMLYNELMRAAMWRTRWLVGTVELPEGSDHDRIRHFCSLGESNGTADKLWQSVDMGGPHLR